MSDKPQDLKPRTKAFALQVIRMYSKLPKSDTVAQVLGKQVLRCGTFHPMRFASAFELLALSLEPLPIVFQPSAFSL